jgi:hypothetical protein
MVIASDLATEKDADAFMRDNFLIPQSRYGWSFEEQVRIPNSRGRIDYVVTTGEGLQFGIECKKNLFHDESGMVARILAGHFEQAAAYARGLQLPVFIGPFVAPVSLMGATGGGLNLTSLAALNIFGGRVNVGSLLYHNYRAGSWSLILRGQRFWSEYEGMQERMNKLVTSQGAKKERIQL